MRKAERKAAVFQLYLGLIDSVYTGFSRDILRAGMLHRYLELEEPPATEKQLAAEMIQTTPYPALREALEERLRIVIWAGKRDRRLVNGVVISSANAGCRGRLKGSRQCPSPAR